MSKKETPLVSICCHTYNHEIYIRDALEGFIMQKTDFPFEVIVHDDASTDMTTEIIREYEAEYPDVINPIYQNENQFSKGIRPSTITFKVAKGKYIAFCEGDDYWTDPLKLQKQVDFLENNPNYVICYHDAHILDETNKIISKSKLPENSKKDFSGLEMKKGKAFILTLSACFRNVISEFPEETKYVKNGDKFLFSLLGEFGDGKYLENILPAAYRVHSGGIWSTKSRDMKKIMLATTFYWMSIYYKKEKEKELACYLKCKALQNMLHDSIFDPRFYIFACKFLLLKLVRTLKRSI